jgi:hypothetical protein
VGIKADTFSDLMGACAAMATIAAKTNISVEEFTMMTLSTNAFFNNAGAFDLASFAPRLNL